MMTWDLLSACPRALAGFALTWLCQSTALLALGLLAGRMLRRSGPAMQSAVYRTTLVAVLACPIASAGLARAGLDGFTLRLPARPEVARVAPTAEVDRGADMPAILKTNEVNAQVNLAEDRHRSAVAALGSKAGPVADAGVTPSIPVPVRPAKARAWRVDWTSAGILIGLTAWVAGMAYLALRLLVGVRRMARLRAGSIPAGPVAEALCREIAGRMRLAAPEVLHAPYLHSPCVEGLRRPAILLPDDEGGDLRDTFVHELAHLARRDIEWNLLRQAATALLWFQPLLWVLARRMEVVAEEVCDDHVVQAGGDRAGYAGLLLELAGRSLPPVMPTAVGIVSLRSLLARRVVRILDSSRSLSTRAGTRALLVVLAAGLVGTTLAALLGVGPRRQALAQTIARPDEPKKEAILRGQVLDPDGRPAAGARVIAAAYRSNPDGIGNLSLALHHDIKTQTADGEGRFAFPAAATGMEVIAMAPGFGLGYYLKDQPIRLTRGDRPINGRLIDLEGRPVAGVSVRLASLYVIPDAKDRREADARPGPYAFPAARSLGLEGEPALPGGVVTDADGRFRIEGLGVDVLATLKLSGPSIVPKRVNVLTRAMAKVPGDSVDSTSLGFDEPGTHGADCNIVVEAPRPIEGFVRDLDTKEPIPGAVVTAFQLAGSILNVEGEVRATTDADGRYRLLGLPKGDGHKLSVYPPLDRPYFINRYLEVPAGPGLAAIRFDIALRRGRWVTGRVYNAKTSAPVAASVDYFPFLDNQHIRDYANFARGGASATFEVHTRYRTDAGGRFRVVGLPGRGVVTARSDERGFLGGIGAETIPGVEQGQLPTFDHIYTKMYQGIREVEIPNDADSTTRDVPLDPGGLVTLRLRDESGKPINRVVADGRVPESIGGDDRNLYEATEANVSGLESNRPRTVVLRQSDRNLGAVVELKPGGWKDGEGRDVTLRPNATVAGRLVGLAKKPAKAPGVRIWTMQAGVAEGLPSNIPIADVPLDADGRFRFHGLPPGGTYVVQAVDRLVYAMNQTPPEFPAFLLADGLAPKPGEVVDLGTFDAKAGKKIEEPAAKPKAADVPIHGRIIDLEGRGVVGARLRVVSLVTPPSDDLSPWIAAVKKGEPPWNAYPLVGQPLIDLPQADRREATTDSDGRFRIEGLGAERLVELRLTGEAIATTDLRVVTRPMAPLAATGFANQYGPGTQTIHGHEFTTTARPGRVVEGVALDAKTRRPMAGVLVESTRFDGSDFGGINILKATTDAQGRFRIVGLPKGKGNKLLATPNDDQPYFQREVQVGDPPGIGPVLVEVDLHEGVWITGKVTVKGTGKPVGNARLHYLPFLDNKFVQAYPEFGREGYNVEGSQMRYQSKEDGSYKLVGVAGRAVVGVDGGNMPYRAGYGFDAFKKEDVNEHGYLKTWNNPIWAGKSWPQAMKEVNPAEGVESLTLDVELDPGLDVRLKVVDAEGRPVSGASVVGSGSGPIDQKVAEGEVVLSSFGPGEKRTLIVRHEGRRLARVVRVGTGDDSGGPIVVTLLPLARFRGRTVDADGRPTPRTRVRPDLEPGGDFGLNLGQVTTDAEGRFEAVDVPTGCAFTLFAEAGTMSRDYRQAWVQDKQVRPGETTDVGDIRFKKD